MAERRMFTKKIIDSDAFLDMPLSTQALYFHLNMRADDDGFVNNPKKIQRMIGASEDDLKLLLAKRFILGFDSGIVVIKHWRMHNLLRKDRYTPTQYIEEKESLTLNKNNSYTEKENNIPVATAWQPSDTLPAPQDSIGEESIDKVSTEKKRKKEKPPTPEKHKKGEYQHVLLTEEEEDKLIEEYGMVFALKAITFLDEYIEETGYQRKSHYLCIKRWVIDAVKEKEEKAIQKGEKNIPKHGSFDINDAFKRALNRTRTEPEMHESTNTKTAADDPALRERMEAIKQLCGQK